MPLLRRGIKPGDMVARDEMIVEIETDKVVLEVPAPDASVLEAILEQEGVTVLSKQLLARLKPGAVAGEPTKTLQMLLSHNQINAIKHH